MLCISQDIGGGKLLMKEDYDFQDALRMLFPGRKGLCKGLCKSFACWNFEKGGADGILLNRTVVPIWLQRGHDPLCISLLQCAHK